MNTSEHKVAASVHADTAAVRPHRIHPVAARTVAEVAVASTDMHRIWALRRLRRVFSIRHQVSVVEL